MNAAPSCRAALVDDEPFVRQDLKFMLQQHQCIEVVWETGIFGEAVKLLKQSPVDLVFLDIQLRGGDGFELMAHMDPRHTRVVIVTAHEKYLITACRTIASDALLKPVNPDRLARVLHRMDLPGHNPGVY